MRRCGVPTPSVILHVQTVSLAWVNNEKSRLYAFHDDDRLLVILPLSSVLNQSGLAALCNVLDLEVCTTPCYAVLQVYLATAILEPTGRRRDFQKHASDFMLLRMTKVTRTVEP